jgi:hypothetical protein
MDLTAQSDSINHSDRQVGADGIKVTKEMLDAGLVVFRSYDRRFDLDEEIVKSMYVAMEAKRLNISEDSPSPLSPPKADPPGISDQELLLKSARSLGISF